MLARIQSNLACPKDISRGMIEKRLESARESNLAFSLSIPETPLATMSTHSQKRVAYQFLQFLAATRASGDLRQDDAESLEVAAQVISEAFGVDLDQSQDKVSYSLGSQGDSMGLAKVLEQYIELSSSSSSASTNVSSQRACSSEGTGTV